MIDTRYVPVLPLVSSAARPRIANRLTGKSALPRTRPRLLSWVAFRYVEEFIVLRTEGRHEVDKGRFVIDEVVLNFANVAVRWGREVNSDPVARAEERDPQPARVYWAPTLLRARPTSDPKGRPVCRSPKCENCHDAGVSYR